jgi:hypothetical protein
MQQQKACPQPVSYKLIFVDVDGVLNNEYIPREISPCIVTRLAQLIKATGASVILSSSWRKKEKNRQRVNEIFLRCGVPMPLSCTPLLKSDDYRKVRADEIFAWLFLNTTNLFQKEKKNLRINLVEDTAAFKNDHYLLPCKIEVTHFVILDDINLRLKEFSGLYGRLLLLGNGNNFIHTDVTSGLTRKDVEEAAWILGNRLKIDPTYCDHCHVFNSYGYDREIGRFFCGKECQEKFYEIKAFF